MRIGDTCATTNPLSEVWLWLKCSWGWNFLLVMRQEPQLQDTEVGKAMFSARHRGPTSKLAKNLWVSAKLLIIWIVQVSLSHFSQRRLIRWVFFFACYALKQKLISKCQFFFQWLQSWMPFNASLVTKQNYVLICTQTGDWHLNKNRSTGQTVTQDFLPQLQNPSRGETPRHDSWSREAGINGKHTSPVQQDPRKVISLHPMKQEDLYAPSWLSGIANTASHNHLLPLFFYLFIALTLCSHPVTQGVPPFLNAYQAYF